MDERATEATQEPLLYEEEGSIAWIRLNRPDKLNALNPEVLGLLAQAIDRFERSDARLAVLGGIGRAFAAGADISTYVDIELAEYSRFMDRARVVFDGLANCAKPVVAAVQGYAVGGGFELVLACDLVIATADARFGLPEVKLGLLPGGGGTQRLPRLVGRVRANELLMTGRFVTAEEAERWGLVNRLAKEGELDAAVRELLDELLATAPLAVNMAKRLVREGLQAPLPVALSFEQAATASLSVTRDGREGVDAFVEKRPAQFEGA